MYIGSTNNKPYNAVEDIVCKDVIEKNRSTTLVVFVQLVSTMA